MIGKEKLFKKLEGVLGRSKADQTEIVYLGSESGLTRYANSHIHQNVFEDNHTMIFRSVVGKQVGVASTNSLVTSDLHKTLADSLEIARKQPENPGFPGLPGPATYQEINTFDEATAKATPKDRAKIVKKIVGVAGRKKFTVAGSCATSRSEIAILNSLGVRAYQPTTAASVLMIPMSETSSGYASGTGRRFSDLDVDGMVARSVMKCDLAQNPKEMKPGDYEVILEPPAVAEMLEWLNYVSFGSKPFIQNMSFLSGNIGKSVTSDQISIYDNALDEKGVAFPFDFEGVPKKKVFFVQKGVAKGVVYDRATGLKAGKKSTGHAVTANNSDDGAFATNICMAPGKVSRDKMVSNMKRGILVTRFHYLNGLIDPRNSVLTGMTRDGTFYVEDGEIKYGLKNLRFTDSAMRALKTVIGISREREQIESWWSSVGCMTVPAIHLGSFKFTGKTG